MRHLRQRTYGRAVDDAHPADDTPEDAAALAHHAAVLAEGIEAAIGPWVERVVGEVAGSWDPLLADRLGDPARAAGREATEQFGPRIRELLQTDVDRQRTGPLALLREVVRFPTEVLAAAGIPPVDRDEFAQRSFPDDLYDLSPASFADVDADLHGPGLVWGAAKAHVILARRRREGLRS